jgi:hypothetical protein
LRSLSASKTDCMCAVRPMTLAITYTMGTERPELFL